MQNFFLIKISISKQKTMTALNYEKDDTIIEITINKKIDNYHE